MLTLTFAYQVWVGVSKCPSCVHMQTLVKLVVATQFVTVIINVHPSYVYLLQTFTVEQENRTCVFSLCHTLHLHLFLLPTCALAPVVVIPTAA